jgi:alkylation response protein AidB-like acyl-CoA dehydrogenase
MYGFTPTQEQEMLIESIHRYARDDLRSAAHEADETGSLPANLISKGWELGLLQASVPEAYGGFGERSAVTGALAAEELAWGDLSAALATLAPSLFVTPILLAGSEEQKARWIAPAIEADWKPYAAALIEPSFDFDPSALRTQAAVDGADYILSGVKTYVPYAAEAEAMILFAALEGVTRAFIVPTRPAEPVGARRGGPVPNHGADTTQVQAEMLTERLVVSQRSKWLALNALPLYEVRLEGVRVPHSNLLEGDFAPVLAAMQVTNAALGIGVARAAFEYSRDYAKEREAFGMKIGQKQAIAFMLAEMATEVEASRLLTWEAAWKLDAGEQDALTAAYLAATSAADMTVMVTDRAVQILGGHGYIRDHPVERWMREGRSFASLTGLAII